MKCHIKIHNKTLQMYSKKSMDLQVLRFLFAKNSAFFTYFSVRKKKGYMSAI